MGSCNIVGAAKQRNPPPPTPSEKTHSRRPPPWGEDDQTLRIGVVVRRLTLSVSLLVCLHLGGLSWDPIHAAIDLEKHLYILDLMETQHPDLMETL